jgi:hypothetical protein
MRRAVWRFLAAVAVLAVSALAQDTRPEADASAKEHSAHTMQGMEMPGMSMGEVSAMPSFHAASGTAWQPASVRENIWMITPGNWDLMVHGQIFVTDNQQGGPRGVGKGESVNYVMVMEQHRLFSGTLLFRQMFSGTDAGCQAVPEAA